MSDAAEDIRLFDALHDASGPHVVDSDDQVLWPDGASRDASVGFGCPLRSPSPEPFQRARAVRRYWEVKLKIATDRFNSLKHALEVRTTMAQRDGASPPTDAEVQALELLRGEVKTCEKALAKSEHKIQAATPEPMKLRARAQTENRQRGEVVSSALAKICI